MKRLVMAAAILAATAGTALAATDTGAIKAIDTKTDAITLNDGKTFTVAKGAWEKSFKVGQMVQVTYETTGGKMLATKVMAK